MRLFLIRHAETVDNVAGVYAGVRNSALTVHGVEQAQRLGKHFAERPVDVTYIFASPLQRATKTAQAIQNAQSNPPSIVQAADLIEQDFGYYEGKSFHARTTPKLSGREAHRKDHRDDPGFIDVETKDSMAKRCDRFLDEYLMPLFDSRDETKKMEQMTIVVVSHGILLSNLWRRLLLRLPRRSITIASEVKAMRDGIILEHLGGWSNTGYLELSLHKDAAQPSSERHSSTKERAETVPMQIAPTRPGSEEVSKGTDRNMVTTSDKLTGIKVRDLTGWTTSIVAIDSKEHLVGLKRQRGGIGRIAHDEGQRKLDGFFKKRRLT